MNDIGYKTCVSLSSCSVFWESYAKLLL